MFQFFLRSFCVLNLTFGQFFDFEEYDYHYSATNVMFSYGLFACVQSAFHSFYRADCCYDYNVMSQIVSLAWKQAVRLAFTLRQIA